MTVVHDMTDTQARLFRLRVAQFYGVTVRELIGGKRFPRLLAMRRSAMWILHTHYRMSYARSSTIAGCHGGAAACRMVEARRASDHDYATALDELIRRLAEEIPLPPPT